MINVLVTAVGNIGIGNHIVKALRLSNLDLNIIGTDISDYCIEKNYLNFFYIVPKAQDEIEYKKSIDVIVEKHNIQIIFIGVTNEVAYYSKMREYYSKKNIFVVQNTKEIIDICNDKNETYSFLSKNGFNVPYFKKIDKIEDCFSVHKFPCIIKPNTNSGASNHIYIAFDMEDLVGFARYMLKYNLDVVVQEYVGDGDSEYSIGVTSNKDSEILGTIIIKRKFKSGLSYKNKIIHNGKVFFIASGITQGEIIHNEKIEKVVKELSNILKSKGSLNIQGMYINEKFKIIEIHPMITGSVYVKAIAGYNEPENIIKENILGQKVEYKYNDMDISKYYLNA